MEGTVLLYVDGRQTFGAGVWRRASAHACLLSILYEGIGSSILVVRG